MPDLVPLPGSERSELQGASPAPDAARRQPGDHRDRAAAAARGGAGGAGRRAADDQHERTRRPLRRRPGRRAARLRGARLVRADRDRDPPGVPPAEGERDHRGDAGGIRDHADRGDLAAPGRVRRRAAPVPDRLPLGPGPALRDHHRRARPRRPAAGPPAVPPGPGIRRQGRSRTGGRNRRRRCRQGRTADRAAGRQLLPVPGRHRRDRADGRDHRARRRLHGVRPLHLLLRARAAGSLGDRRGR